ncbi:MAG: prephenate dehydrogenase [Clostridia bacterium]|nr:prephenate dehydrogenase [Clostridia bacterium]
MAKPNNPLNGTIVICGLGLMGGSLAFALQQAVPARILGMDRDPDTLMQALRRRAIDDVASGDLIGEADMLILALPPQATVDTLKELAPQLKPGTIVTDVCGVKRFIVEACDPICREHDLLFVGGHPMAGKEKSGFAQADAALFNGACYILTPAEDLPTEVIDVMHELVRRLGCARLTVTTPEVHDRMIAFTSQLPHVLAGCYVQSPCSARHEGFSAGSYRDVSRVAGVDETLWSELFSINRDMLESEVEGLIVRLEDVRKALKDNDRERLEHLIKEGRLSKVRADELPQSEDLT